MEKIFKKSLALILSAALCLTALVGCLTVSAEGTTAKPTYALNAVEGKPGDTVTVTANITNATEVCAHLIDIVFPKDLTIGDVTDSLNRTYLTVEQWEETGNNSEIPAYNLFEDAEGKHIRFVEFVNWPDTTVVSDLTVNIQFKIPATATAGTVYTLTPTVQAGEYDDTKPLMDVDVTAGKITVTTATVCEHEWKFVSAVPATYDSTGETAKGSITFKCSKCSETNTEEVSYLAKSTLALPAIGLGSTTQLKLRITVKNYDISTDGYIVGTHTFLNGAEPESIVLNISEAGLDNGNTSYEWNIGVKSVSFCEEYNTTFFTKRNGAWVSGKERAFSIKSAAMSLIKGSDETYKTVAANLLKMGAEAQKAFNYAVDTLPDSELVGDYANYVTTTTPSVERNGDNWAPPKNLSANKKAGFTTPSVGLSDSILFMSNANLRYYEGATDDVKIKITYTSSNGAPVSEYIEDVTLDTTASYLRYSFSYGMTAPNLRTVFTIQVFNGDTAISDPGVYSIESALYNSLGSYGDLIHAIMNYSDSAKAVF